MTRLSGLIAGIALLASIVAGCRQPDAASLPETIRVQAGGPLNADFLAQYQQLLAGTRLSLDAVPGSVLVVSALQQGTSDIGFAQADVVYTAYRAGLPENSTPHTKLRGIAVWRSVNTFVVVRRDSPFRTVSDLKHRRIAITPVGTRGEWYARMILGAYGIDEKAAQFVSHTYDEMALHLRDRTVDAVMFGGAGIPSQMVQMNNDIGIRVVGLTGDVITKLRGQYPFFNRIIVTPQDIGGQPGDADTLGVDNLLVCRQDLSDERVYQLTRGFIEASNSLAKTNANFPPVDPNGAAATPIPLHPGAARYYREREVLQ